MLRLDMRFLHRNDWLRPGLSFTLSWSWRGEPTASIGVTTNPDAIRLSYSTKDGEQVEELVDLDRTPCTYGGTRPWFLCPKCGRRVGVLFAGRRFWCRHCHGIAYAVENEDKISRLLRRANKLRERVGAKAGTAYPVTFKPKGMHQKTFDRIRWEIQELETSFWLREFDRLGITL
jgi:hypothetical protein